MKRINIFILILLNIHLISYGQEVTLETRIELKYNFITDWMYFRMQKNPSLPYKETHDEQGGWINPFKFHTSFFDHYMVQDLEISPWGYSDGVFVDKPEGINRFVNIFNSKFYLVEKKNGLSGLKDDYLASELPDSMLLSISDSIFPYDNRFLAVDKGKGKFTFHSGNVLWGEWQDVGFVHQVDIVGYIRGVQFGVQNVKYYRADFSANIRRSRPEYPDYEYTEAYQSQLSKSRLLIGAPRDKEDQLIEFIYYSNKPEKTGDSDLKHFYEMRYILPTEIKSIKERRLEKRLLSEDEWKYILNPENKLFYYIETEEVDEPEIEIEQ